MKYILAGMSFLLILTVSAQDVHKVKKIKIVESGNTLLDKRYRAMDLPDSINTSLMLQVRQFSTENGIVKKPDDLSMVLESLRWVSSRWMHDGNNSADTLNALQILENAKKGIRYRCVEYGRVLSSTLRSWGFISRPIGFFTSGAAYGPPGSGHFATEVWIDNLKKWIFLDPQFCIYTLHKGQHINFYEMAMLANNGRFEEIEFVMSKGYEGYKAFGSSSIEEHINDYKKFLRNFFGTVHTVIKLNGKRVTQHLILDKDSQVLTFQGFPSDDIVYAGDVSDMYFPVNQSLVIFKHKNAKASIDKYSELVKNKTITNYPTQFDNMWQYAPDGELLAYNDNNMPWFDHYEMTLNGKPIKMNANGYFEIKLIEGMNTVTCVAVNKNGKNGVVNTIRINYGE